MGDRGGDIATDLDGCRDLSRCRVANQQERSRDHGRAPPGTK
jgi:hypothetical protein